jgi:hypothetical protein
MSKDTPKTSRRATRGTRRAAAPAPVTRSGLPITDELASRLADEAERGYDLSRGRRVGRPSLAGSGTSPRVNFRVSPALHQQAQRRAESEGKRLSQLAREALEVYLA